MSLYGKNLWNFINQDCLWRRIIIHEYISLETLLIHEERNPIKNASDQLKVLVLTFPIVGRFLVWGVGDGTHVRIREDTILGRGNNIFLPMDLIHHLHDNPTYLPFIK